MAKSKVDPEDGSVPEGEAQAQAVPAGGISLTQDQLLALLGSNAQMAQAIMKIAESSERGPIKQIPLAKAVIRTAVNPEGKKDHRRPKLKRATYLNGYRLREALLKEEEIKLLNTVKAGRYHNKKWSVREVEAGDDESGSSINIYVPNKTQGDRLLLAQAAVHPTDPKRNGLIAVLDKIIAEQTAVVLR
jgi:hypothetical protein